MTDQGRPMSRRARREAEARGAAQDTPTTPIPEAQALTSPDGIALSRKERRRLERLERPLETWTVEEEMIATGQVPVMTPDALDAQERIERERAEREQEAPAEPAAHVERAASVLPGVDDAPTDAAPAVEPAADQDLDPDATVQFDVPAQFDEAVPVDAPEQVDEPAADAAVAAPADLAGPEEPFAYLDEWPQALPEDEVQEELAEPQAEEAHAPGPAGAAPEPESEPEPEPETAAQPTQPAPGEIPDAYRHLFPPGSLQAQRLQERTAGTPQEELQAPAAPSAGADEIRRLTALAMAGIEAAQTRPREEADAFEGALEAEPDDEDTVVLDPAEAYAAAEADDHHEDQADGDDGRDTDQGDERPPAFGAGGTPSLFAPITAPVPRPAAQHTPAQVTASPVVPTPAPTAPEQPGASSPSASLTPSPLSSTAGGATIVPAGFRPAGEGGATGAPSVWDAHPLTQSTPRPVADYTPSENIPIPDFTKIMHGYASTSSSAGATPDGVVGDGPVGTELPTDSGIEMVRRPLPETQEGAHHFGWQNLSVIAAVAFLLGVLVWHLTGNAG